MGDSFPNLRAIAASAGAETSRRTKAGSGMYSRGNQSNVRLFGDDLRGQEEGQQRGHSHQSHQNALDAALARREAGLRQAAAMAQARFEQQERLKASEWETRLDNSNALTMQQFQTDENIRQAEAVAAINARYEKDDPKADDGLPRLSDFGRHEINPMRGQALTLDPGGLDLQLSDDDRKKAQEIISKHGSDPDPSALIQEMRKLFGNRDRTASKALWDLGYRGPSVSG